MSLSYNRRIGNEDICSRQVKTALVKILTNVASKHKTTPGAILRGDAISMSDEEASEIQQKINGLYKTYSVNFVCHAILEMTGMSKKELKRGRREQDNECFVRRKFEFSISNLRDWSEPMENI